MVIAVRTERGTDGLEIVKEAGTEADRFRLLHEAMILRRAAHPGVVDIVSESRGVLRLRHRGTPLARLGPLPPDNAAAVIRAVADTVAALHQQGIAHGRINGDHVLLGERGRPRLCGFGDATEATDESRAVDVAALGRMLDQLLDAGSETAWSPELRGLRHAGRRRAALQGFRSAAAAAQRPEPGQRPTARHLATALHDALPGLSLPAPPVDASDPLEPRGFSDIPADFDPTADLGWSDDDLSFLAVAEESDEEWITGQQPAVDVTAPPTGAVDVTAPPTGAADDPEERPEERPEQRHEVVPRDRDDPLVITIRPPSKPPRPDERSNRRLLLLVAIVVLVLGAIAGSLIARSIRPFGAVTVAASTTTTAPSDDARSDAGPGGDEPDSDRPGRVPPSFPAACAVPPLPGPDIDGDDCPEPVTIEERIANVGDLRIELGEPGDLVAVADSDCDGIATPVVLRPRTGEVFVFASWSLSEPVEVPASTVVAGGEDIDVGGGPCPSVVVTGDGVRRVVAGDGP